MFGSPSASLVRRPAAAKCLSAAVVLLGLSALLLLPCQRAVASSQYDYDAYAYIQEGTNIAMDQAETYGDQWLWYAYEFGSYAEDYALAAMDNNNQLYWAYAYIYAYYAAYFAGNSENGRYAADALQQGADYALLAYENYYSTAF